MLVTGTITVAAGNAPHRPHGVFGYPLPEGIGRLPFLFGDVFPVFWMLA